MDLMFRHGMTPTQRLMWLKRLAGGGGSSILKTVTGTLLHITDALAKPAKKFTATLEPIQDLHGQANPYPAGGGKNLIDFTAREQFGVTAEKVDGKAYIHGTNTGSGSSFPVEFKAVTLQAGTYVWSISGVTTGINPTFTKNGAWGGTISQSATLVLNEETEVGGYIAVASGATVNTTVAFQLESGSTSTGWSPYSNICPITGHTGVNVYRSGADTSNPTTIPITFPDAAGTVCGGTLTHEGGEWKLRVTMTSAEFDGSSDEGWSMYGSSSASAYAMQISVPNIKFIQSTVTAWSNYLPSVDNNKTWVNYDLFVSVNGNGLKTGIRSITTVEAWVSYLAENPLQIVYELATPIDYTLTESQALTLLKGENNIWTDIPESELELTYYAKAEETP